MNRGTFFKALVGLVVAPKVAAEIVNPAPAESPWIWSPGAKVLAGNKGLLVTESHIRLRGGTTGPATGRIILFGSGHDTICEPMSTVHTTAHR